MVQFLFFLCSFGELTEWSSSCKEANIYIGSMLSVVGQDEYQPKSILWTFWQMVDCTSMPVVHQCICSVFSFESYPVDLCMPPLGGSLVYLQCIRSVFGFELYPVDLSFLCVWLVPIMDPPRSEQPLYSRQILCYGLKLL